MSLETEISTPVTEGTETPETVVSPEPTAPVTLENMTEGEQVAVDEEGAESAEEASFEVELAHPTRGGDGPAEKFRLAVPDQKTADTLRYTANRAALVPKLEQQVEEAQESVRIVEALERDPVAAMTLLAQDPKVGAEFGRQWLTENWKVAVSHLLDLGFKVDYGTANERVLDLEAREAKRVLGDRIRKAQESTQKTTHQQQFQSRATQVVNDLVSTLSFSDPDDHEMFVSLAAQKAAKLYQTNPYAQQADLVAALKPLVDKFVGRQTQTIKATVQPRNAEGQFVKAKAVHDKMRKIGSGSNGLAPATPSVTPGMTLEQMYGS